jgi:hypothetical protein
MGEVQSVDGYLYVSEEIEKELSEAETEAITNAMTDMYDTLLPYRADVETP